MNYQCVFHGVEQDAPASLRVREREDWPIEGGRAHTHRGSAFGAFGARTREHYIREGCASGRARTRTRTRILGRGDEEKEREKREKNG